MVHYFDLQDPFGYLLRIIETVCCLKQSSNEGFHLMGKTTLQVGYLIKIVTLFKITFVLMLTCNALIKKKKMKRNYSFCVKTTKFLQYLVLFSSFIFIIVVI